MVGTAHLSDGFVITIRIQGSWTGFNYLTAAIYPGGILLTCYC
jgi:hypothetical protein